MRLKTLRESILEAKRFIKAGENAVKRIMNDRPVDFEKYPNNIDFWRPTRESGAARCASMDLTRKLADLRAGR